MGVDFLLSHHAKGKEKIASTCLQRLPGSINYLERDVVVGVGARYPACAGMIVPLPRKNIICIEG
jgi:hypothetical protein